MNQKQKPYAVALYLPSLRGGGTERAMVTLANGFSDRGIRVDLVLAKAEGPYLADVSRSIRVVDLGVSRVLASLPGLVRYLRRERPTALLSAMGHANVIAIVAHRLSGTSTRLFVSERSHFSVLSANEKSIPGRSLVHLMRWTYPATDGIVAVSRGVAADLAATLGMPRSRVQVIHNPVVTAALLARSREALDHPWFGPAESPVVLSVGRLTEAKDFPSLIRAFGQLRAQRDIRLMILGEGELRLELEGLVRELGLENDVSLPGFVSNPYAYMRHAALYVLSSACEGLPNALIEAMACGALVVATDCPSGPAEILEDGRWGRLVPVGDVDALARAMAATLDEVIHPDSATRAADFGIDQAVMNYLQVLLADGAVDTGRGSVGCNK